MGKFKRIFCVNLTVLFAFPLCFVFAANEFPIGAIFDSKSNNVKFAFVQEINRLNNKPNKRIQLKSVIQELDATDSFAVSNAICALLRKGVYGIIGVSNASALSTIQSYSNTFQVPFIVLGMAQNTTNHGPFQLFMRPLYTDGLLAVITNYGWERILYIYDTDEGLLRLQQLFQVVNMKETTLDIDVKRVANPQKCYEELKKKQKKHDKELFRVLLDMSTENAEEVILKIKNDTEVRNHMFHFLLGELRIEEMNGANFAKGGMNITGFQLLNYTHLQNSNDNERLKWDWPDNFMSLEAALVIDALGMLLRALNQLENPRGRQPAQYPLHVNFRQSVKCTDSNYVSPLKGTNLTEKLKEIEYDGLTGKVSVDEHGFRNIFTLNLEEITMIRGLSHVGRWTPDKVLTVHDAIFWPPKPGNASRKRNITTILEKPYLMYKDPKHEEDRENAPKCGKEYFEGFCAELAQKVAAIVGYDYELCLVKDGEYGQKLEDGTWSGVIGELTREEVDLAVAPITITSTRERVVDFTKPYMSLGISIMIKKTSVKKASVFSFMDPLSYEIWMCILFAYIGVSVVLFLVSRFSPTEWHIEDGSNITNDFTISNSLWYSLGAFMQQGCDISPRSVSGRIVGSVWWFFTLIIISSYTANLAAFLTVERMLTPIESAEDLAKQTEIQYGTLQAGSTKDFFQYSKFPVYERMWAYMQSASPSVLVKNTEEGIERVRKGNYAYLIESTTNDYNNMRMPCDTMRVGPNLDSKGYGIATPIGSVLRDDLTLAVLKLRESGDLKYMQKKWWDERSECPAPSSSQDGGQTELTLSNVAGIFYILVAGLLLSVIIACLEFLYKSKLDSKRSKKSFGSVLRCKARLSFRGSLDRDTPASSTPLRKSMSTYTYTGPTQMVGNDGFPDNTHTQV